MSEPEHTVIALMEQLDASVKAAKEARRRQAEQLEADVRAARDKRAELGALLERITERMEVDSTLILGRDDDGWSLEYDGWTSVVTTGQRASPTDALQSLVDQLDAQTETEK